MVYINRGALMLYDAICQIIFHQNVIRENSPKFEDIKVSQYTLRSLA